ncbi:MAG: transposase [Flavobacteriaceae bacterium]
MGKCLSVVGARPLVNYQHKFENTYLWGSYSPITGESFVWEINGVDSKIFEHYLEALSQFKPREFKVVIIDNAAFHSTTNIKVPDNIYLLNIPAYCPELNPCEQIWQYIKKRYKNKTFEHIGDLRKWLWDMVCAMDRELIKSIVANKNYKNIIYSNLL